MVFLRRLQGAVKPSFPWSSRTINSLFLDEKRSVGKCSENSHISCSCFRNVIFIRKLDVHFLGYFHSTSPIFCIFLTGKRYHILPFAAFHRHEIFLLCYKELKTNFLEHVKCDVGIPFFTWKKLFITASSAVRIQVV